MYHPLIAQASNIKTQENPVYTKKDFLEFYPQFTDKLPDVVMESFLQLGQDCVSKQRSACTAYTYEPQIGRCSAATSCRSAA